MSSLSNSTGKLFYWTVSKDVSFEIKMSEGKKAVTVKYPPGTTARRVLVV